MAKSMAGGRQTSGKTGVRSTSKKMDNSRYGFRSQPASHKVAGASGREPTGLRGPRRKAGTEATRPGKAAALDRSNNR